MSHPLEMGLHVIWVLYDLFNSLVFIVRLVSFTKSKALQCKNKTRANRIRIKLKVETLGLMEQKCTDV